MAWGYLTFGKNLPGVQTLSREGGKESSPGMRGRLGSRDTQSRVVTGESHEERFQPGPHELGRDPERNCELERPGFQRGCSSSVAEDG